MDLLTHQKPTRTVLRYFGGKWRLAPWIMAHFPPHETYTEVYGGAASVLMRKPRARMEVYNDRDDEVVNVFHVLRDPACAKDLTNLLRLTPFARTEFNDSYAPATDPVEKARRTIIRSFMGHGTDGVCLGLTTGLRRERKRNQPPVHDWVNYPDQIDRFVRRLTGVLIENRPALDVLAYHDSPSTLHYVDPPYPLATLGRKRNGYRFSMTDDDHREMGKALQGLKGMVIVSGYACPLYDEEMFPGWERVTNTTRADGGGERTEILWLNPATVAASEGSLRI